MSFFSEEDAVDEPARKRCCTEQQQRQQQQRYAPDGVLNGRGEGDEEGEEQPVLARERAARVGVKLLQGMQKPLLPSSSVLPSRGNEMRVVQAYVPLSVGGFMESSAETTVNDISHVRPGNIMCLRCPTSSTPQVSSGMNFVKETDLTEEERRYGKRLSSNMMHELFEVGRVDRETGLLEAIFLDGARQKLKVYAVRPAGFVETELFHKWKRDPSSRPVRTVYAAPVNLTASSSLPLATTTASAANRNSNDKGSDNRSVAMGGTPTPWWVSPQLVVRVVEKSAGDIFGKKFVVRSLARKEGKIRLAPWQRSPGGGESAANSLLDIVGCEALETVAPKVGEQGMIVLGSMRGELVTVMERHRDADGELASLKVCSTLTQKEFVVGPHELCQLARPQR
ncbi:Trypanosoma vivax [Trypanosoma rangeli]|uniref:Trypanosoma vivax n=1 Tax=Trypanosoma rangeli TaxID=5698 RepID=A0A3R7R9R9_TRYRA|nr:Trypanosoma vivax [Trypanosoma rangeli]RNE98483.1 Trypanosoma vivax [Trypanosoma rangeli]|eukprot:RNE98483.1 Trypanosoma vivax [Trypanosoma rangeli]